MNTAHEEIFANIRANIRRQLPQVQQYQPNGQSVALVCGGPSLTDELPRLRRMVKRGYKLVTVNATHEWVQDRGLKPSAQVMLDAREFNARFVARPVKDCRYLLCSQVHPAVFDALDGHDVHIWHGESKCRDLDRYYLGKWMRVNGGSTVATRAMFLLFLLGFRKVAIFGMDCCMRKGEHHAYAQPENDFSKILTCRVGRRRFKAHPWMLVQADEFLQIMQIWPEDGALAVYGDGLLSHIVNLTAERGRPVKAEVIGEN